MSGRESLLAAVFFVVAGCARAGAADGPSDAARIRGIEAQLSPLEKQAAEIRAPFEDQIRDIKTQEKAATQDVDDEMAPLLKELAELESEMRRSWPRDWQELLKRREAERRERLEREKAERARIERERRERERRERRVIRVEQQRKRAKPRPTSSQNGAAKTIPSPQ